MVRWLDPQLSRLSLGAEAASVPDVDVRAAAAALWSEGRLTWGAGVRALGAAVAAASAMGTARLEMDADGGLAGPRRAQLMSEACARASAALKLDVDVSGALPRVPCVIVANHLSWLDPVVLGGLAPGLLLADVDVQSWPLVGPLCRSMGVLFVERGSASSGAKVLRAARRAIADGTAIIGFPEQGDARGAGVLRPFQRGLFGLARACNVPVVPVTLHHHDAPQAMRAGFVASWPEVLRVRPRISVCIGAPIFVDAQPLGGSVRRVREVMRDQLARSGARDPREPVVTHIGQAS